ncbi:uncharacterized protein LOC111045173 isoform X2 [Nilaparvata lugens]|uniref:uncharacterized protein LOC111045173 isoform X2 n=1 Tax=Nilaparvata lugens TaxID=108931 RepID=UPI00193E6E19|nr:uncharacterized protein LOC111045173 isoform X2 [Nilaparvata lugens]
MQSELDSTSPSSPTPPIQSSPTPPIQSSPTITISTSRPIDSTTVQLKPIHSTTDQSKSTENTNPKSSTTTLKPAENFTSYDTTPIGIRDPTERPKVDVPSSSINTPFYSLENKGAGSTINQEPRDVHKTSETTSRSTTSSSYEVSSLGTTFVNDLSRHAGTSRGNISTDKHELEFNNKQSTNSGPRSQLEETRNTDLRRSDPTTAVAYFSNNSSFDQLGFRISNHRDQVTDYSNARRVTDFNTNYQPRQNYGTTTRMNPVTFHGSISEIPFQGGFVYPNKPHRQPPPLGPTVPTQYSFNRNNWMDQNNGYPQFRVRQEPGRYIDPNPFLATTMNPDIRRAWEMRLAESHPIFVSNNRKILPALPRTPVALPPIQIPNPNFSSNSRRLPLASSSTATPLREERDYRCLGQWEEDGLMYTYTQRRDIGTYECFVGSIISDTEIYIKEAGEHCERSVNPLHLGMKLTNKGKCTDGQHNPIPSDTGFRQTPYPPHPTMWHSTRQPYVTKPWKPITAPPRIRNEVLNGGHVSTHATNPFIAFCTSVLFVFYTYTSLS